MHAPCRSIAGDIVSAADVGARGAFYHHFADKAALFKAVFEQVELDPGEVSDNSLKTHDTSVMAHLLLSAVDEAALYIAHAPKPKTARSEAGASLELLLTGIASLPNSGSRGFRPRRRRD